MSASVQVKSPQGRAVPDKRKGVQDRFPCQAESVSGKHSRFPVGRKGTGSTSYRQRETGGRPALSCIAMQAEGLMTGRRMTGVVQAIHRSGTVNVRQ